MRVLFAITALALAASQPSAADDLFDDTQPVELEALRGGTETTPTPAVPTTEINGSVIQTNETNQTTSNTGSISIGADAIKANGSIKGTTVTGNHGIAAVMQNTGDLVNMTNATSVNVFLK